ncbi:MAG: hypothetical protein WAU45_23550 [Blastocatellia bacterium]
MITSLLSPWLLIQRLTTGIAFEDYPSLANTTKAVDERRIVNNRRRRDIRCSGLLILVLLRLGIPGVSEAANDPWTSVGPQGGRVQALAIDPSNADIIYAGTDGGGVLKSTNGGAVWTTLNTGNTTPRILPFRPDYIPSIAIDRSSTNIIYAGTDGGIIKSTNGGLSWVEIRIRLLSTVDILAIDPSNTRTVYAGSIYVGTHGAGIIKRRF